MQAKLSRCCRLRALQPRRSVRHGRAISKQPGLSRLRVPWGSGRSRQSLRQQSTTVEELNGKAKAGRRRVAALHTPNYLNYRSTGAARVQGLDNCSAAGTANTHSKLAALPIYSPNGGTISNYPARGARILAIVFPYTAPTGRTSVTFVQSRDSVTETQSAVTLDGSGGYDSITVRYSDNVPRRTSLRDPL